MAGPRTDGDTGPRPSGFLAGRRQLDIGPDGFATLGIAVLVIGGTAGLSFVASVLRVVGEAIRSPCEAADGDCVVVLGGGLRDGAPSADFEARLERARALAAGRPIIILGGVTRHDSPAESAVGQAWLVDRGVDAGAIVIEAQSRDTLENLRALRPLIGGETPRTAVLVTSRYHVARTALMARGLRIPHLVCAAEQRFVWAAGIGWRLLHEGFLVHWYVVGRGWARLTRNGRMLARIS